MALIPVLLNSWFDGCLEDDLRPARYLRKRFDSDLHPEEVFLALDTFPRRQRRKRCRRQSECCNEDEQNEVVAKRPTEGFEVHVNVKHFKPEEISVKATDKCITVEGKHEQKDDENGYVMRHFVRRYQLPEGLDNDKVSSTLSSDGVLTISAPKLALSEPEKVRMIPVIAAETSKEVAGKQQPVENGVTLEDLKE